MKNSETLFAALGEVSDRFLPSLKTKRRRLWRAAVAVAAAAAVLVGGLVLGGVLGPRRMTLKEGLRTYPLYSPLDYTPFAGSGEITPAGRQGEGGGGLNLYAYTPADLEDGNPWDPETCPASLPVFKNLAYTDEGRRPGLLGEEEMRKKAEGIASLLGQTVTESKSVSWLTASTKEGTHLQIEPDGTALVGFGEGTMKSFPLSRHGGTREEAEKTLLRFADKYQGLLQFASPAAAVSDTPGFVRYLHAYWFTLFDRTGDPVTDILNYNLRYAVVYPGEDGNLSGVRICDALSHAEYVGDYPILSPEEAADAFFAGEYGELEEIETYKTDKKVTREDVTQIKLLYHDSSIYNEYFLPYYELLVKIEEKNADENLSILKAYYDRGDDPAFESWDEAYEAWTSAGNPDSPPTAYAVAYIPALRPEFLGETGEIPVRTDYGNR